MKQKTLVEALWTVDQGQGRDTIESRRLALSQILTEHGRTDNY